MVCNDKHINTAYEIIAANKSSEFSEVNKIPFPCS